MAAGSGAERSGAARLGHRRRPRAGPMLTSSDVSAASAGHRGGRGAGGLGRGTSIGVPAERWCPGGTERQGRGPRSSPAPGDGEQPWLGDFPPASQHGEDNRLRGVGVTQPSRKIWN